MSHGNPHGGATVRQNGMGGAKSLGAGAIQMHADAACLSFPARPQLAGQTLTAMSCLQLAFTHMMLHSNARLDKSWNSIGQGVLMAGSGGSKQLMFRQLRPDRHPSASEKAMVGDYDLPSLKTAVHSHPHQVQSARFSRGKAPRYIRCPCRKRSHRSSGAIPGLQSMHLLPFPAHGDELRRGVWNQSNLLPTVIRVEATVEKQLGHVGANCLCMSIVCK